MLACEKEDQACTVQLSSYVTKKKELLDVDRIALQQRVVDRFLIFFENFWCGHPKMSPLYLLQHYFFWPGEEKQRKVL